MIKTKCTYCETEFETDWYNVCDNCMKTIVEPLKRKPKDDNDWKEFKREVWRLTEEVAHKIPSIEKRGFKDHHIDHKYSIWKGFKDGKTINEISDISNLRMLPYKENMIKGIKCE